MEPPIEHVCVWNEDCVSCTSRQLSIGFSKESKAAWAAGTTTLKSMTVLIHTPRECLWRDLETPGNSKLNSKEYSSYLQCHHLLLDLSRAIVSAIPGWLGQVNYIMRRSGDSGATFSFVSSRLITSSHALSWSLPSLLFQVIKANPSCRDNSHKSSSPNFPFPPLCPYFVPAHRRVVSGLVGKINGRLGAIVQW